MDAAAQEALVAWYRGTARDLPWRRSRDPYAIWVSEVMLQQTRVDVVAPRHVRWMQRFPDLASLAAAPVDEVLAQWSGLGYYARARRLHEAAQAIAAHHGGRLPAERDALLALPGFGPYTAGAVASIAFGQRVPCVDGNVERVASRRLGLRARTPPAARRIAAAAEAWVAAAPCDAGTWNQAVMELGATVCTPRAPACGECPVRAGCKANASGAPEAYPAPRPRPKAPVQAMRFALVRRRGQVLLVRPRDGLLAGLWSLPGGPVERPVEEHVMAQAGVAARVESSAPVRTLRHQFTHRTWDVEVVAAVAATPAPAAPAPGPSSSGRDEATDAAWFREAEFAGLAMSSLMRKVLA